MWVLANLPRMSGSIPDAEPHRHHRALSAVRYHARVLRRCSVVLAALTLSACQSPPKPDAPPTKKEPASGEDSPDIPEPVAKVPAEPPIATPLPKSQLPAPLTVAIHPAHWSALHSASMPLLAKLPDDVEPLRKASSPEAAAAIVAAALFGTTPPEFKGWDTSRPILIALGETDYEGVAGATVGQLPLSEGWVPGTRHQALIPATDSAALLESFATLLSSGEKPVPELAKGHPGAVAMHFDEWSVVVLPAPNAVRIVVFEEYVGLTEDKAIAHMIKRLDDPIHTTASAAARVLKDDGAVLAAWFRPDRLRSLAVTRGGSKLLAVLPTAPAEMRSQLTATGMSLLMSSDAFLVDEGAEIDEVAMTLRVDGDVLRLQQLATLSDEGEGAFAAATKDVSTTFAVAAKPVWADLVVRANLRALLSAVEPPSVARVGESPGAVREAMFEGGSFSVLHMLTRHGLGLARFAELSAGPLPIPTDTLPTAAHAVWAGVTKDDVPRLALALHWPKAHEISGLTTLLQAAAKRPDFASLTVLATEYAEAPTHVLGFGGMSKKAFAVDTPSPAEPLIDFRANVPAVAAAVNERDPELGEWLVDTSDVHFTLRHDSYQLIGEFAWSPGGGGEVAAKPLVMSKSDGSPKSVGNPATTEAERCVGKAAFAYAGVLRAVTRAAPEKLGTIVNAGLDEASVAVACAAAEPKAKAAVEGLRRVAVSTVLDAVSDAALKDSIRTQQCALDEDAEFCKEPAPTPGE